MFPFGNPFPNRPEEELQVCHTCGKYTTHVCVCKTANYCSLICQAADWLTHYNSCASGMQLELCPPLIPRGMNVVRGLYFDPGANKAQIMWFQYHDISPGDYVSMDLVLLLALTSEEKTSRLYEAPIWFDINRDVAFGTKLGHTIRIVCRGQALAKAKQEGVGKDDEVKDAGKITNEDSEGSLTINKTVRAISQKSVARVWRGPYLAFCIDKFKKCGPPEQFKNFDIDQDKDLRCIRNFINGIGGLNGSVKLVQCVRINCDGEVSMTGCPKYESISLPSNHAIFQQSPAPISKRLGLSVTAARIPGSVDMWQFVSTSNLEATYLYRCCDPKCTDAENFMKGGCLWGMAPMVWDIPVGSCIVARKDKKALLPGHVETLSGYCLIHLGGVFQMQSEQEAIEYEGEVDATGRAQVLEEISKEKFKTYFQSWKDGQTDPAKRGLISPYNI